MSVANWGELREPRIGIMIHYDGSASDAGAVDWLTKDPRCKVSYNWLITDDGRLVTVAPDDARAWHAGKCKPNKGFQYQDANSAFYGIALAMKDGDIIHPAAWTTLLRLCRSLLRSHQWTPAAITGHSDQCWPRGRKVDPEGTNPEQPTVDLDRLRKELL